MTRLTTLWAAAGKAHYLRALLTDLRPLFSTLPKAKTAKLVRTVLDAVATVPDTTALQLELCVEQVAWCRAEKRNFLRHRIEIRLATLLLATQQVRRGYAHVAGHTLRGKGRAYGVTFRIERTLP